MIELEIQALALSREGLLIDVGRCAAACGFALVRQRLADDRNGTLLTMVVRGLARNQRTLETALDKLERIISFEISPVVEGQPKPHFAASRSVSAGYVPPPPPAPPAETPKPAEANRSPKASDVIAQVVSRTPAAPEPVQPFVKPQPLLQSEPEPEPEFVFVRTPAPAPPPAPAEPFKELIQLDADQAAVEKLLPKLMSDYPQILPLLKKLEQAVEEGARESSLSLAGQRIGTWLFERNHAVTAKMGVDEAMERIGVPALRALAEVDYSGNQLHIRNSPLCTEDGRSSCKFFSGYLEGLIGPVVASQGLSIFAVCCRSCGADECVLALMD
ncbi:hypothetical protein [Dyella nitratireducens]|uniref:4-vinyl reductase 4VR domain-containing protein n=1 Tax=Dyella nitratireducens TaxID=1849580 RepID=A0ABQ1FLV8_9GAMM|nr:hypothetical protein [Dyella nitratireducens]GGA20239.1 hypothetical protein GCM10010981_05330 [Dyella nitratireducens]GLQ44405.1 hypothetical protein GCM10007902_42550 [Dyella nitratireducens]